jgi:hypothetical protein
MTLRRNAAPTCFCPGLVDGFAWVALTFDGTSARKKTGQARRLPRCLFQGFALRLPWTSPLSAHVSPERLIVVALIVIIIAVVMIAVVARLSVI